MNLRREGSGPITIVAVHGIQGTAASWLPVARALADRATFVLPNLRGRADAARGTGPDDYRLPCLAQDLATAIDSAVGTRPYYLAGWSLGVSVALDYLGARSDRHMPRGLVLVSGTPKLRRTRWFVAHDSDALRAEAAQRVRKLGLAEAADDDAAAWTWQAIADTDQSALLPYITTPTLVIHGSDDDDCPILHGQWLANALPDATLSRIDGGGHALLSGATARVAQDMARFIAQCEPSLETA